MADAGATRPSARLPFRVRALLPLLLLVLGYASIELYGRVPEREVAEISGRALGTSWSIQLAVRDAGAEELRAVQRAAEARLRRIDDQMSTWRDDSDLARFNGSPRTAPVAIEPQTAEVVAIALEIARESGGALDVTVGPLVEAWGFGRGGPRAAPPDAAELAGVREAVGWQLLRLESSEGGATLAKERPRLGVDLSAVAKGYAVDEVARALDGLGYSAYLVEIGGELRARGAHLDGRPWRVAIEAPDTDAGERRIHRIVALRDRAMATSGDYRNYYEVGGRRVSHTIDPRTGRPIEHALASVTVLHDDAARADAWATALTVLGPDAGYARAVEQGLAAYLLVRSGDGFEVRVTPAFEPHLIAQPGSTASEPPSAEGGQPR